MSVTDQPRQITPVHWNVRRPRRRPAMRERAVARDWQPRGFLAGFGVVLIVIVACVAVTMGWVIEPTSLGSGIRVYSPTGAVYTW